MTAIECLREHDVHEAVRTGRWPAGVDADLAAHVESCHTCRDLALVASLLRRDGLEARADVPVPAAGQVWWRAAVRARLEARESAARPLTWAEGLAGAVAVGLVLGSAGMLWPALDAALTWMAAQVPDVEPALDSAMLLAGGVQRVVAVALVAAIGLVLAPLAVYLVLSDD